MYEARVPSQKAKSHSNELCIAGANNVQKKIKRKKNSLYYFSTRQSLTNADDFWQGLTVGLKLCLSIP